jgi:hypothetical protein
MNVSHLLQRQHAAAVFGMAGLALCLWPAAVSAQSDQEIRCMQLEQELANDWQGDSGASELPRIQSEIARVEQVYRQNEAQAERQGCYENFFIFGRGLVRTPRCLRMHNQIEDARRQLARLQQQRDAVGSGGGNRRRDRVLEALARNGCGPQYQQQARREPRGFFEELFGGFEPDPIPRRDGWTTSRIDPTMPYRTLCVRECDGYYYPISYSVMPSAFASQRAQCQTQCAAPADLYVYPNPGGQVEQSVSLDGKAYMDHPNAFKYRKDYVKGCSCKVAEYNPAEGRGDARSRFSVARAGPVAGRGAGASASGWRRRHGRASARAAAGRRARSAGRQCLGRAGAPPECRRGRSGSGRARPGAALQSGGGAAIRSSAAALVSDDHYPDHHHHYPDHLPHVTAFIRLPAASAPARARSAAAAGASPVLGRAPSAPA